MAVLIIQCHAADTIIVTRGRGGRAGVSSSCSANSTCESEQTGQPK